MHAKRLAPEVKPSKPQFALRTKIIASFCAFMLAASVTVMKTCRAYISVLGEKEAKEATIKGLNSAEGYIRRQLARNLNLRNTPEIRFILDESIEYGVNMSKLIDDVTKKDSNSHRQDEEQDEN